MKAVVVRAALRGAAARVRAHPPPHPGSALVRLVAHHSLDAQRYAAFVDELAGTVRGRGDWPGHAPTVRKLLRRAAVRLDLLPRWGGDRAFVDDLVGYVRWWAERP